MAKIRGALVAVTIFTFVLGTPGLARAAGGDYAAGGGTESSQAGGLTFHFGFSIRGSGTGTDAAGMLTATTDFPGVGHVTFVAAMTCLDEVAVPGVGIAAGAAGHIIATNANTLLPIGSILHTNLFDTIDATAAPDQFAGGSGPDDSHCSPDFTVLHAPFYAVTSGNILITQDRS